MNELCGNMTEVWNVQIYHEKKHWRPVIFFQNAGMSVFLMMARWFLAHILKLYKFPENNVFLVWVKIFLFSSHMNIFFQNKKITKCLKNLKSSFYLWETMIFELYAQFYHRINFLIKHVFQHLSAILCFSFRKCMWYRGKSGLG